MKLRREIRHRRGRSIEALGVETETEKPFDFLRTMRTINERFQKHAPHITRTHLGPETVFLLRNTLPESAFKHFLDHAKDSFDPSDAAARLPENKTLSFLLEDLSRIRTHSPSLPVDQAFLEKISSDETLNELDGWLSGGSDKSLTIAAEMCFLVPQVIDRVKAKVQANRETFLKKLGKKFGGTSTTGLIWLYILDEGARPALKTYVQEHWGEWEAYLKQRLDEAFLEQKTISLAPSELQSALSLALAMEILTADTADFTPMGGLDIHHASKDLHAAQALPDRQVV